MPALVEAKLHLYETMRASKIGKCELARRMNVHLPQVDRLLAMTHGSTLDQIEAAFGALGKRLVVGVEDVVAAGVAKNRPRRSSVGRAVKNKSFRPAKRER